MAAFATASVGGRNTLANPSQIWSEILIMFWITLHFIFPQSKINNMMINGKQKVWFESVHILSPSVALDIIKSAYHCLFWSFSITIFGLKFISNQLKVIQKFIDILLWFCPHHGLTSTGHAFGIWIWGCSLFYRREFWASKFAGTDSTYSLKIRGCKRWCPKDLCLF